MKTYEEMAHDALSRISDHEAKQKRIKKITAPAVSLCLAAVLGIGAWQAGLFTNNNNIVAVTPDVSPVETPEVKIITADPDGQKGSDTTGGCCIFWWNGLSIGGALKLAIEDNPDGVFAVLATYRPTTGNITSFIYEGKTLAEWAIAADDERILPEKMAQLLKLGDELKYGTALYETGTPDGIKWDRSWYENQVAFFGDLLDKYIVDGEFLRETLEKDIAALQSINITASDGTTTVTYFGETSARKQYSLAYNAYLETVLPAAVDRLTECGIKCERTPYTNNGLIIIASAQELKAIPLDDLQSWSFDLASGELKGAPDNGQDIKAVN